MDGKEKTPEGQELPELDCRTAQINVLNHLQQRNEEQSLGLAYHEETPIELDSIDHLAQCLICNKNDIALQLKSLVKIIHGEESPNRNLMAEKMELDSLARQLEV